MLWRSDFRLLPPRPPGLFVPKGEADRASKLLEHFLDQTARLPTQGVWICSACGESVEANFDLCWNCESPRGDLAIALPDTAKPQEIETDQGDAENPPTDVSKSCAMGDAIVPQSNCELWLEVLVVLAVAWLPNFSYSVLLLIWPAQPTEWSYLAENIWSIVNSIAVASVVLYIIHRGDTPWRIHGIKKPRVVPDLALAMLIWLVVATAATVIYGTVASVVGRDEARDAVTSIHTFGDPVSKPDYFVLVILCLCIGFSEELAMRAYLIPRFEQLFTSTTKSVILSSILFASYHLYQGAGAALLILVVGVGLGVAFCMTRRLWPIAIAHAAMDLVALS